MNGDDNSTTSAPSQSIEVQNLDDALHQPEASSGTTNQITRNLHNLRLEISTNQNQEEPPSVKSETSSVVPTSARLSIATTHHTISLEGNNDNVGAMLDSILANPGWNAGRERRNSLFSMRSLQPTLPPYEEYRNHVAMPIPEAGPSALRQEVAVDRRLIDEKRSLRLNDDVHGEGEDAPVGNEDPAMLEEVDPENSLTAHYSRIVRTIDSRYTSELERLRQEIERLKESHAEELALMRNNVDAAYRNVWKKRNQEVERAKEEAASRAEALEQDVLRWKEENTRKAGMARLEAKGKREALQEQHVREIEREKNAVEDVWERRWRDRMNLLAEEKARSMQERDEKWLSFLREKCPQALQAVEAILPSQPDNIQP